MRVNVGMKNCHVSQIGVCNDDTMQSSDNDDMSKLQKNFHKKYIQLATTNKNQQIQMSIKTKL